MYYRRTDILPERHTATHTDRDTQTDTYLEKERKVEESERRCH